MMETVLLLEAAVKDHEGMLFILSKHITVVGIVKKIILLLLLLKIHIRNNLIVQQF